MNLTLFYSPITCSMVPYIALTEAQAPFKVRVINLALREHMEPEYLRLNPKHKVPVLLIDGEPLTENVAIQLWIARTFPQAQLLPHAELDEYRAISMLAWCASGVHAFLTPNILPQRYCDLPGSEESVRRCAQRMLHENFQIAEGLLAGREFFFDYFTLPDAYFFWCFRRGTQFQVDMNPYPACRSHFERLSQRASVQKLLAFEAAAIAKMEPVS
jgi:glutathione S-transferase